MTDRPTDRYKISWVFPFFFRTNFLTGVRRVLHKRKETRVEKEKKKKRELRTCCECVKLLDAGTTKRCGHNRRQVHTILTDPRLTSANKRPGFSVSNIPKNDNLLFKKKTRNIIHVPWVQSKVEFRRLRHDLPSNQYWLAIEWIVSYYLLICCVMISVTRTIQQRSIERPLKGS